jgi:hypothetical protein
LSITRAVTAVRHPRRRLPIRHSLRCWRYWRRRWRRCSVVFRHIVEFSRQFECRAERPFPPNQLEMHGFCSIFGEKSDKMNPNSVKYVSYHGLRRPPTHPRNI